MILSAASQRILIIILIIISRSGSDDQKESLPLADAESRLRLGIVIEQARASALGSHCP
jgi:hypothetical protein